MSDMDDTSEILQGLFFKPLWYLLEFDKIKIETLAEAIEKQGIQGWDRFGRFKKFNGESKGDDLDRYSRVLDTLAKQYQWEAAPGAELSPLDEKDHLGHPFVWGWLISELPDFLTISGGAAHDPVEPTKPRSRRSETTDKNILGVFLEVLLRKAGYKSEAALIDDLINLGYGDYDGISKRTLEDRFKEAKLSLRQ